MPIAPEDVYRCREDLVTREIVGETIIVPISGELANLQKVFSLNPTGAFVWARLDGATRLEAIHDALTESFEVDREDAWEDLSELVDELREAALIEKVARP